MFKRLLLGLVVGALLTSCAKPPVAELADARTILSRVYASGASSLAPKAYQLASEALQAAEELVLKKEYDKALTSLDLARIYSEKAFQLANVRKQEQEREEKRLAEERRQAGILEQAELLREQRDEKKRQIAAAKQKVAERPSVAKVTPEAVIELVSYVEVTPGENLANIAAKPEVYGDERLWPLIYKANRDQIKDPKQIFAGQRFLIPRDKSSEEIAAAKREAEELNLF